MKPRPMQDAPALSAAVVAVLLNGWCAKPPDGGRDAADFDLFHQQRDAGVARHRAAHETWLRATAAAWRWRPSYVLADGRALFYGEFVTLPRSQQFDYWLARGLDAANAIAADADDDWDGVVRHDDSP